jgi:SpoVK/Ycf46/Vps4 family AAA+-type ATPase
VIDYIEEAQRFAALQSPTIEHWYGLPKQTAIAVGKVGRVPLGDYARRTRTECLTLVLQASDGLPGVQAWAAQVGRTMPEASEQHQTVAVPMALAPSEPGQHRLYPKLFRAVKAVRQVWLTGPPGSGKTHAAEQIGRDLGLPFYMNGATDTEYKLLGFRDATSNVAETPFFKAYTGGGIYLGDEFDAWLPNAGLALNAALTNGTCDFAAGPFPRHKDFYMICAANTWGNGATSQFVGRNRQDGAFLDRFTARIHWDYDEQLERRLTGDDGWCDFVQTVRSAVLALGLQIIVSPRASIGGAKLIKAGFSKQETAELTVFAGLPEETIKQITNQMTSTAQGAKHETFF